MRRRARGIVGLVVLSLGLGVVTTYGVAWGLVNTLRPTKPTIRTYAGRSSGGWEVFREDKIGITWVDSDGFVSPSPRGLLSPGQDPKNIPAWSLALRIQAIELYPESGFAPPRLFERGVGWPRLAVADRTFADGSGAGLRPLGASLQWGQGSRLWSGWSLPLAPIWRGLAVDTAFFGCAWAAVVVGVVSLRRRMRVKAGMCVRCRYDLQGLAGAVCPECGSASGPSKRSEAAAAS